MYEKTDLADRSEIDVNKDGIINKEDKKLLDENLTKALASLTDATSEKNINLKDLLLISNNINIDFNNDGKITDADRKADIDFDGDGVISDEEKEASEYLRDALAQGAKEQVPQTSPQVPNPQEVPDEKLEIKTQVQNRHELLQEPVQEYTPSEDAQGTQASTQAQNPAEIMQQAGELINQLNGVLTQEQGQIILDFVSSLANILSQYQNLDLGNFADIQESLQQPEQQGEALEQ